MQQVRPDIGDAVSRMHLTFGIRSTIRKLPESLEPGELVQAMVACFYSGSDGVLVLTDRRVIAVRDDLCTFRLQAVPLGDVRALDYAPSVHDGLAVLTDTGRIAVRRMNRQDADALATLLVAAAPGVIVGASHPQTKEGFRPDTPSGPAADAALQGEAAVAAAAIGTVEVAPAAPDIAPAAPAVTVAPAAGDADGARADQEVLLGVLADLHAKGLLSDDELAAKIAQVASAR